MATISKLSVSLTARTRAFRKGINRAKAVLGSFTGAIFNVKTALVGLVGAAGIGFLTKGIVTVNAKFQTLKSSLKTVTGGTKEAARAFKLIQKFAATTPFDLDQVVSSFIKLKALGLDPSEAALRSYGNTSSAMGKSLEQMIEAVADAVTGEFERLKEFGIKARSEGDNVTFTFQGVATTVKKTAADIEGYLRSIGDVQFAGATEDMEKNLAPAISNIGDAWEQLAVKIGESGLNDLIAEMLRRTTDWINSIKTETVEKWTHAIVDMGFTAVRWILRMVAAGGLWISQGRSFGEMWTGMKLLASEFAEVAISSIRDFIAMFDRMILMVARNQGFFAKLFGFDIKEPIIQVSNELDKLQAVLGKMELDQMQKSARLRGELASQKRIRQSQTFDESLFGQITNFEKAATEGIDSLQNIFKGEPDKQLGPLGRDPALNDINEGIKQQNIYWQQFLSQQPGAVAG